MRNTIRPAESDRLGPPPTEPPSWTGSGSSIAAGSAPATAARLSDLFSRVESSSDYFQACRDLAAMFSGWIRNGGKSGDGRGSEGGDETALRSVLRSVVRARFPRVWMERFLFALLAVEPSDWQTAAHALRFVHLRRLLHRVERRAPLTAGEGALARDMITVLALSSPGDFEGFAATAAAAFRVLRGGGLAVSGDLGLLIYLLRGECAAMVERSRRLEERLPQGDLAAAARLTPHLDLLEERIQQTRDLARRLGSFGPVREAPMGLEEAMGDRFATLLAALEGDGLDGLREVLELQRSKRIPTRDLIALSSLCRWVCEARGVPAGPLEWVRLALGSYEGGRFGVDAAGVLPAVRSLASEAEIACEDACVSGDFGESPCSSWVARDGLTRPYRSANPDRLPPDPRRLALANIHRETVILKLLEHSDVREARDLVADIVVASPSPAVHTRIASERALHAGPARARVAALLLQSPVSIPAVLARRLVDPSLISFSEMKALYRRKASLRPEVAEALHAFLSRAYAL